MRKINVIWLSGLVVNVLMMFIVIWQFNSDMIRIGMIWPVLWMVANFLPITLLIAYFDYTGIQIDTKVILLLLIVLLLICLVSALYPYFNRDFDAFRGVLQFVTAFLILIQLFIIYFFFAGAKDARVKAAVVDKDGQNATLSDIKSMEKEEVTSRVIQLMDKRSEFQKELDIASDPSMKYNLKEQISDLDDEIDTLKKRIT